MTPRLHIYFDVAIVLALLAVFVFFTARLRAQSRAVDEPMAEVKPLDNGALLRMIDLDENWDGESIGAAGESGPWQMLPSTWRQYTKEPYPYSERKWREPEAQRVIHAHASWIRDQMERHRWPQTAYTFALVWKAGYGRVLHNTVRTVDKQYAERGENIYRSIQ